MKLSLLFDVTVQYRADIYISADLTLYDILVTLDNDPR